MKFLIDAALSPSLSRWLASRGHDAVHVLEIGMERSPDSEILRRADDEDRIVLSADLDFPRLLALLKAERPGLILFRGGDFNTAQAIELLSQALSRLKSADFTNAVVVLDGERIRRRPLPLE